MVNKLQKSESPIYSMTSNYYYALEFKYLFISVKNARKITLEYDWKNSNSNNKKMM
jgi:hypothetical protein